MSKQSQQSVEGQNLVACLSDGVNSFSVTVSNVSRLGMVLNDIPQRLKNQVKKLSLIVFTKSRNFKLKVEPKWFSGDNSEIQMGVTILDPPIDWTVFAMICEPSDKDIFAMTAHSPVF